MIGEVLGGALGAVILMAGVHWHARRVVRAEVVAATALARARRRAGRSDLRVRVAVLETKNDELNRRLDHEKRNREAVRDACELRFRDIERKLGGDP